MCNRLCVLMILWLLSSDLMAQPLSNIRSKTLTVSGDTISLDTLNIVPSSLVVSNGNTIYKDGIDYQLEAFRGQLIWKKKPLPSTIQVRYRVFSFRFDETFSHKDISIVEEEYTGLKNPFSFQPGGSQPSFFRDDGLKMNGNFSRGIAVGNNQDLVVNSNLNLQLAGKLNGEIDVLAAISDENNPIQPEGNTQQLQDFDRVYIQLRKDSSVLTVGDFQMSRPRDSYFMNYYKRSRGAQFSSSTRLGGRAQMRYAADLAVSRGRFARNIITAQEGNQGPYRLSGINGEQFIIIISGTEAVYVDGKRLTRGEQNDYIIDYNAGEVVFMPNVLITQYSRIVVEFQYSDRNYARTVFHFNDEIDLGKWRIRANYFSEQDNKNQPFQQDLTDEDKLNLQELGDRLDQAFTTSVTRVTEFSSSLILYRSIDTLGFQNVYVHATDPNADTVFYQVGFSYVGEGNGDYQPSVSGANGRVFEWIQPVNGQSQGAYVPLVPLVTPKQQQMYTLGVDYLNAENLKAGIEIAGTRNDKNLFSDKDSEDDQGLGYRAYFKGKTPLSSGKNPWIVRSDINYEFVDRNFRYIERYRAVEFDRIWNRQLTNQTEADTGFRENILSANVGVVKGRVFTFNYGLGFYDRASVFQGLRNQLATRIQLDKTQVEGQLEWMGSDGATGTDNSLVRRKVGVSQDIWKLRAGAIYEDENSQFQAGSDTLLTGSFRYEQMQYYLAARDSTNATYRLDYTQRTDFLPRDEGFGVSTIGRNVNFKTSFTQKNTNRLLLTVTWRDLAIRDTALTTLKPDRSLLTRVEYNYNLLKRAITANTYYQLGTGVELRRDFTYIKVQPGLGVYEWIDYNDNGIEELNEFEIAAFANTADYIRVFLPTNTFVQTNTTQFNQSVNINPGIVWRNKTGIRKSLSKFSNITALRIDRKTLDLDNFDFINPFTLEVADTALITVNSFFRSTLFFNRSDPKFGFDLNFEDNRNKNLTTNGFEGRTKREQGLNMRWNASSKVTLNGELSTGQKESQSEFFDNRNYRYTFIRWSPRFIYQFSANFRATALYVRSFSDNVPELGGEEALNNELGAELRYNVVNKGVLNLKYSLFTIDFTGQVNTPVGFDMLQGLQDGRNTQWSLGFQQRLAKNIQVDVSYEGRRSEGVPTIHVGRIEARYLF